MPTNSRFAGSAYLQASANHALVTDDTDWASLAKGAVGAVLGGVAAQATIPVPLIPAIIGAAAGWETGRSNGAFVAASAASGALSFYNTGVDLVNMFGGDAERVKTEDFLRSMDEDVAQYYHDNKTLSDVTGLVAGSVFPAAGALRVYRFGAAALHNIDMAKLGANSAKSLGLLVPARERALASAVDAMKGPNVVSAANADMLKAFGLGVGEEAIQGAIASSAVLATMHAHPFFDDFDTTDTVTDIALGTAFGAVIGGAVRGIQAYTLVGEGVSKAQQAIRPQALLHELHPGTDAHKRPMARLLNAVYQRDDLLRRNVSPAERELALAKREETRRQAADKSRELAREVTAGDDTLGVMFADTLMAHSQINDVITPFIGTRNVVRAGRKLAVETKLAEATQRIDSMEAAQVTELDNYIRDQRLTPNAELRNRIKATHNKAEKKALRAELKVLRSRGITDENIAARIAVKNTGSAYMALYGDSAGQLIDSIPKHLNLADRMTSGHVKVTKHGVDAGDFSARFSFKDDWHFHAASFDEIEARYYWMMTKAPFSSIKNGSYLTVDAEDLPALTGAYLRDAYNKIQLRNVPIGTDNTFSSREQLYDFIVAKKQEMAHTLSASTSYAGIEAADIPEVLRPFMTSHADFTDKLDNISLSNILDVSLGMLEGTGVRTTNEIRDVFKYYGEAEAYTEKLLDAGLASRADKVRAAYLYPKHVKVITDATGLPDLNEVKGMAALKEYNKIQKQAARRAVAAYDSNFEENLVESELLQVAAADSRGPGASLITSADKNYGSTGSFTQSIGKAADDQMLVETARSDEALASSLRGMLENETGASAVEFSAIVTKARARSTDPFYLLRSADGDAMVPRSVYAGIEDTANTSIENLIAEHGDNIYPIENKDTADLIAAHIKRNGQRQVHISRFNHANGYSDKLDTNAFYPPPRNPKDYKYFAFVTDPTISGQGHVSMIYASNAAKLDELIGHIRGQTKFDVVKPPKSKPVDIITKREAERYYKALGEYRRQDVISDNYIDETLKRTGKSADYVPTTRPGKILDDLINWHHERDRLLVRKAVITAYGQEFAELRNLAESSANVSTSKAGYSSLLQAAEESTKSPYVDYIKTALNITALNEVPNWTTFNNLVDERITSLVNSVSEIWRSRTPDAAVDEVNRAFDRAGIRTAFYNAKTYALSNMGPNRGAASRAVNRANAITATLMLRMDPTNAWNNVIGSTILTSTEYRDLLQAIKASDPSRAGKLAFLNIPGVKDQILAPGKLYAKAIENFFTNPAAREFAKKHGFLRRHIAEFEKVLDDLALQPGLAKDVVEARFNSAYATMMRIGDFGEKATLNRTAEEFNRFISADIMRQITDVATDMNIMTKREALAYINTFVNRTQGNYLASQRPLLFSGPVGSALGLFQTYQFNLMQQMFRHLGKGAVDNSKSVAMLLGMQGTIYGMRGLPAFSAINQHLIGQAAGNENHKDLYDLVYSSVDKDSADWIMHGVGSNIFGLLHPDAKINLYTRGDVNPRYATIVPTNIADFPFISASAKFFSSMYGSLKNIANGGDIWISFLQGLEHNGLNRPLAGLATVLKAVGKDGGVYTTSNKGNLITANALASVTSLMRISGAKPLDEALTTEALFRIGAYQKADSIKLRELGNAIKTTALAGNHPTASQLADFAARYAALGGHQKSFNKWMISLMKNANAAQANIMAANLGKPEAQTMQLLLGGSRLPDTFTLPK